MPINMLLLSEYEYRRGLANRLLDEGIIDFCIAEHLPWTESPPHNDRIIEIDNRVAGDMDYCDLLELNELPSVSKELMELMLPYESTAVKMYERTTMDSPTAIYFDGKRKYLQHLRYWNYMLDKHGINCIVTHSIPHSMGAYVVYGLSRIKKIPMLIWTSVGFFDKLCFWGNSINGIGEAVGDYYNELKKDEENKHDFQLSQYIIEKRESLLRNKDDKCRFLFDYGLFLRRFYGKRYKAKRKEYRRKLIRYFVKTIVKERRIPAWVDQKMVAFRSCRRSFYVYKYFLRHDVAYYKDYLRICDKVDLDKPFIVFFLQVDPEASILPLAGVFEEQYNSVWILARAAAKFGVRVFVREHPAEGRKSKNFYAMLKGIPNVWLVDNKKTSVDMMKKSICVATQTGTCIIESMLLKKPAIAFGDGYYYKGRPGLFEVFDEESAINAVAKILEGVEITEKEIQMYLYAIQKCSLEDVDPSETEKRVFDSNYVVPPFPLDSRVKLIKRFINESVI